MSTKVRMTVDVPENLHSYLKMVVGWRKETLSHFVLSALKEQLKQVELPNNETQKAIRESFLEEKKGKLNRYKTSRDLFKKYDDV